MADKIDVPPNLVRRLMQRQHEAQRAQARLEGAVEGVQAALGVPDGYTLDLVDNAFVKADGDD